MLPNHAAVFALTVHAALLITTSCVIAPLLLLEHLRLTQSFLTFRLCPRTLCPDVVRDGVNKTVCVLPLNSEEGDKQIVTAVGTVILFGCVLYSW